MKVCTRPIPKVKAVDLFLNVGRPEHSFMHAAPSTDYLRSHCSCCFDSVVICQPVNKNCNGHDNRFFTSCEVRSMIRYLLEKDLQLLKSIMNCA